MGIMATGTGGGRGGGVLWPTSVSTSAFLLRISLLYIVTISFSITLITNNSREGGCALFLPFSRWKT